MAIVADAPKSFCVIPIETSGILHDWHQMVNLGSDMTTARRLADGITGQHRQA